MKHTLKKVAAIALAVLMCVSAMVPSLSAAATCPGKGKTHTVQNCAYTEVETAATCNKSGNAIGTCNACGDTFVIRTMAATGVHDWTMPEATCVAGAKKVCNSCGTSEPVAQTSHKWSSWTLTGVSVCTVGENVRRTCSACGAKESVAIPAEGHYFELASYVAPSSCTVPGTATYLCVIKGCGTTKTVEIEATGASHTYVSWAKYYEGVTNAPADPNFVEPTCTTPGTMTVLCKDCGRKAVIADNTLKAHQWRSPVVNAVAPKCDVDGTASYTLCVNCRLYKAVTASDELAVGETTDTLADLKIAKLHDNPAIYYEALPTCSTDGQRIVKCPLSGTDNCGWTETVVLKALGAHVYYPDVTDAKAQKEIMKKLGITTPWADLDNFSATPSADQAKIWTSYTAATCVDDAVVVWNCLNCAEKLYGVTSAQYVQCTNTKEATPAGNDFVKKGHNFDATPDAATTAYPAATCTTPGVNAYTCKNTGCGYVKTENAPANGHRTYVDKTDSAYKAATCKVAGTDVIKCYDCSAYKETVTVASTGNEHVYEYLNAAGSAWSATLEAALKPTCTKDSTVTRRCTVDGCDKATPESATLAATGHTYMDVENAVIAKELAKLVAVAVTGKSTTYTDSTTNSVATCIAVGGCENGYKYTIKCADCAMFKYHEVTEGYAGGHVKVYINGTAVAATCTTPELSNKWYCKNSFCEYYCEKYEDAVAAAKLATLPQDKVAAPNHNLWDEEADAPAQTAVTYKDVPYNAIKDAKDFATASAVEAPVDAKGNVTRYVAIPGTTLIWVFKYTPDNHTEATVSAGGFYCTECTYAAADKVVFTKETPHSTVMDKKVEASCLTYGYELWVCTSANCFYAVQKNFAPVADHDDVQSKKLDAKCDMDGYIIYECKDCGRVTTAHLPAKGHNTKADYTGDVITTACNDAASSRKCAICNETIAKIHVGEVGTKCSVCKVVIPAN